VVGVPASQFYNYLIHLHLVLADWTALVGPFVSFVIESFDFLLGESLGNFAYLIAEIDQLLGGVGVTS
jgi:hypothetical protein